VSRSVQLLDIIEAERNLKVAATFHPIFVIPVPARRSTGVSVRRRENGNPGLLMRHSRENGNPEFEIRIKRGFYFLLIRK